MASALVGTAKRPPMWTTNDLRVTAGTSIDLAIRPNPLTQKEDLLLLSLASPQNVDYPATADIIRSTAGLEFLGKIPPSIPSGRCAATELMLLIASI